MVYFVWYNYSYPYFLLVSFYMEYLFLSLHFLPLDLVYVELLY